MRDNLKFLKSPAVPSAILLYGIVFLFAVTYLFDIPWHRAYTIALYGGTSVWAAILAIKRFKQGSPAWNPLDVLFAFFLICILVSAAINWWVGTVQYLKLMPALFLAPYVLGRTLNLDDGLMFRRIVILIGILLVVLIVPEYIRVMKYGLPYENSPTPTIFGQSHGVMLSGLLLATALVSLVSVVLSPCGPRSPLCLSSARERYFAYVLIIFIVLAMGWISSRVGVVVGIVGLVIVLLLAPTTTRIKKLEILMVLALAVALAATQSLQWEANSAHYRQVLKPPIFSSLSADDAIPLTDATEWKGSILGSGVCEQIVDSISDRWIHFQQAFVLFLAKPLIGVGANHYGFYACSRPGSFPHSTVLQVFSELGLFVGLAYCAMLALALKTLLSMRIQAKELQEGAVWSWMFAFAAMQILAAQFTGNYFISAALNFSLGIAASARNHLSKSIR